MGVSSSVVEHLRGQGHDAVHLRERGLQRAPDHDIFALAATEGRIILTFDLDFAEIAAAAGASLPSVLIFRLNDTRVARLIDRLSKALLNASNSLSTGAVVVVDDARIRVRDLPIER